MAQQSSPGLFLMMKKMMMMMMMMRLLTAQETSEMLEGEWTRRYVSDPEVRMAAQIAMSANNQENQIFNCLLRILKAESQVVSGVNYYLTVKAVSAPNIGAVDRCPSPPHRAQQVQICKFEVWSRPWLNKVHLTAAKCTRVKP